MKILNTSLKSDCKNNCLGKQSFKMNILVG